MSFNSELIDATDLDQLADRREAQELLPHLIRRLLTSTPGVTDVSVRAGEGIGVRGWDGRANIGAATSYLPAGPSRWEMGTEDDPRAQAEYNYRKRTGDPLGISPASTTFVFATMHRWSGKEDWRQARQADGKWRRVVALDADDLQGWLEATPSAHIWLSELTGRFPSDVQSLDRWWRSWSAETDPVLPASLLLAGRNGEARKLRDALQGTSGARGLCANSRNEAVAFLAASLLAGDEQGAYPPGEDPLAGILVVSGAQAWARLAASPSRAVLVPQFDDADVALAANGGHRVLVPMGRGDVGPQGVKIELPRIARDEARNALRAAGWSIEDADRCAAQARRSLQALRRELAIIPRLKKPAWAVRPAADAFAPLMLLGSWSADLESDQEIVAAVADRKYAVLERDLVEWEANDDPPFRRSGRSWLLADPLDAWTLLSRFLTPHDLARWRDAALRVLRETDPALELPPADRPFAALRGAARLWSDDIRRGLGRGAAILGTAGELSLADGRTAADHAASLIQDLLAQANADALGRTWRSLGDVLPLLAEAAPEQFLDGVEVALAGDPPLLRLMFTDSRDMSVPMGSSPHIGLQFALETLCWSPRYLSRATDALARLAQIDLGGWWGNRPHASLRHVLLPWAPQTSASLPKRLEVIKRLVVRRSSVGWPLLLSLLPSLHDVPSPTAAPSLRDWKQVDEALVRVEYSEAIHELVGQALAAVGEQPARWVQLLARLQDLRGVELKRCLDALEGVAVDSLGEEDRLAMWTAVTRLVEQHREFSTAPWALPDSQLRRLEAFAGRIEPTEMVERHARLFNRYPDVPGKAQDDARHRVIQDALGSGGVAELIRLAEKVRFPRVLGAVAADVDGSLMGQLLPWLADEGPSHEVAVGFVIRMSEVHGRSWVQLAITKAADLPDTARVALYLALPKEPHTWGLVESDTVPVQDLYWKAIGAPIAAEHATDFAERLLDHRRPWSTIDVLALYSQVNAEAMKPTAGLIERALRAALASDSLEIPQSGLLQYDVGTLLDRLETVGTSQDILVELELAYFPLLQHTRAPRATYARLAESPRLFVEMVCAAFRARHEASKDIEPDAAASSRAGNYYWLLHGWHRLPGTTELRVDGGVLRAWVTEARQLLALADRAEIGDERIGELLSGSPMGQDGIWPAEPIRDIIEDLESEHLEDGLIVGRFNSRGVTMRGVYDGGKQEVELREQYRSWAERIEGRWLRTGRVLQRLAEDYARQAHIHDEWADRLGDEG